MLLAAADTFRAAAREQLLVWAGRNQVEIVSQQGGDPAAVSFDAVVAGKARGCDVVIADTAGRLPTQTHLMEELKKIRRTIAKAQAGAPHEVLLVVDGNTGQNALAQVKAFDEALGLTGLIVTKLDGTAKGGVLAAIARWGAQQGAGGAGLLHRRGRDAGRPADLQRARIRAGAGVLSAALRRRGAALRGTMSRSSKKAEGTGSIDMSCAARSPSASSSSISATGISGIGREPVGRGCGTGAAWLAERSSSAPNSARTSDAVGSWSSLQTCTMMPAAFSTGHALVALAAALGLVGRADVDHRQHARAGVAHQQVGAEAARAVHPFGMRMARRHAQEARQRHLRQHQEAGQRVAQQVVGAALGDGQHAHGLGRPGLHGVQRVAPCGVASRARLPPAPHQQRQQQQGGAQGGGCDRIGQSHGV